MIQENVGGYGRRIEQHRGGRDEDEDEEKQTK
jgi:hypothetical protein